MSEFVSVDRINALKSGIEAKTGETYTDLTDGVQALMDGYGQGGGGADGSDVIPVIANTMTIGSDYADTPEIINLHFLTMCSLTYKVDYGKVNKKVKIIGTFGESGGVSIETFNMTNQTGAVREIDFGGAEVVFNSVQTFRNCKYLEKINAVLRTSGKKWDRTFLNCEGLVDIRFAVNHISVSGIATGYSPALSDDSLISTANALVATTAGDMSWGLHATPKARCEEILGTVTQKTADDGTTYDFFTSDSAGTVTLTEFITVTKGWTLA